MNSSRHISAAAAERSPLCAAVETEAYADNAVAL